MEVLDLIFLNDKKNLQAMELYRSSWAQTRWVLEQVLPYVPDFVREHVQAEYKAHMADKNFSFYKSTFGKEPKPLIPLAVHLQKRSSTG